MNGFCRLAAVGLALAISGCGDGGTGPEFGLGSGSAEITGNVNRSISGMAVFGRDAMLGSDVFVIVIDDSNGPNDIGVVLADGNRPGPGTYALGNSDSPRYGEAGIGSDLYESESGQLTITSSSAQRLQGTMTFTARRFGGTGQINVTGTFDAVCLPAGVIACP